jgi:hypothetical protein
LPPDPNTNDINCFLTDSVVQLTCFYCFKLFFKESEMTHTLIKRGQARGQGGFAIGLILLVVLLIAVIIAAIALATRNGTSKANEKDRVIASNLVQQAVSIDQAIQRSSTSNGTPYWAVFMMNNPLSTPYYNQGNNVFGTNGGLNTQPQIETKAFDGSCQGASAYVNLKSNTARQAADGSALGCQWHVTTFWGRKAAATSVAYDKNGADLGAAAVLYTFPLTGPIGSQVNNILWGVTVGKSIRITGTTTQTPSSGFGKNWPSSVASADGTTNIGPVTGLATSAALSAFPTTFFRKFGVGADQSVTTANGAGIASSVTVAVASGEDRFPRVGPTPRREGVVQVGGSLQQDSAEVIGNAAGARVYYRALNNITD